MNRALVKNTRSRKAVVRGAEDNGVRLTPRYFFEWAATLFGGFDIDVAASHDNALAEAWYDEAADALAREWPSHWWCNPPYGRTIGRWVRHGAKMGGSGRPGMMLVPVRCGASWWRHFILGESDFHGRLRTLEWFPEFGWHWYRWEWRTVGIHVVNHRLSFGGGGTDGSEAPFASALLYFGPPGLRISCALQYEGLVNRCSRPPSVQIDTTPDKPTSLSGESSAREVSR